MPNFFVSHKRVKVAGERCTQQTAGDDRGASDLRQAAPRSRPRSAGFPDDVRVAQGAKYSALGRCRSKVMKLFTGWVMSAGVVLASAAANAQVLAPYDIDRPPYAVVSDLQGPYSGIPQPGRYGPSLLPPQEVYTVLRESGFSPLGTPQRRGLVYTIAVIDRGGEDGRLVIDARTGRIMRFLPAYRMGDNLNDAMTTTYGPVGPQPV